MPEKEKKAVLIGIWHNKGELEKLKKTIDQYAAKGKTIALETPTVGIEPYWREITDHAKSKGMRAVAIDSNFANVALDKDMAERLNERISIIKGQHKKPSFFARLKRNYKRAVLMDGVRERFMVKKIRETRPDIIVVGVLHCAPIRRAVPIKKFVKFGASPAKTLEAKTRLVFHKLAAEGLRAHRKTVRAIKRAKRRIRKK